MGSDDKDGHRFTANYGSAIIMNTSSATKKNSPAFGNTSETIRQIGTWIEIIPCLGLRLFHRGSGHPFPLLNAGLVARKDKDGFGLPLNAPIDNPPHSEISGCPGSGPGAVVLRGV